MRRIVLEMKEKDASLGVNQDVTTDAATITAVVTMMVAERRFF